MKKYSIAIEETVVTEFQVIAKSEDEALEIAQKKYADGEFVLAPGEVQYKQMAVTNPHGDEIKWIDF